MTEYCHQLEKYGLFYRNQTDHRHRCLRLLDASWVIGEPDAGLKNHFRQGHIPGALHFDLDKVTPKNKESLINFPLPSGAEFRDALEPYGIDNDTHVVVYDSVHPRNSLRAWYLFRLFGHTSVSVLDGGLGQWQAEGNPVTNITINPYKQPVLKFDHDLKPFQIKFNSDLLVEFEEMEDIAKTQSAQIIDVRVPESFQKAHIPGAINIPFSMLFTSNGTFKSQTELKDMMLNNGLHLNKRIVAYCNGGLMACGLVVAGSLAGADSLAMYNGSWFEWSRRRLNSTEDTGGEKCCNSK